MKNKTIFGSLVALFMLVVGVVFAAVGAPEVGVASAGIGAIQTANMIPAFGGRYRAIYDYIRTTWGEDLIATPSYLRVEKTLTNNLSTYDFDILRGSGDTPVEVKLDKNDVFICTHIGMYIIQYVAVANVVTKWTGILQTYPNASELTGPTTPRDLNALYNGNWSISVGRVKFFDKYPASLLFRAAETQQSSATNYSSREYAEGAASIDPLAILSGSANNSIQLNVPIGSAALAIADQGTTSVTKVVFHPYGFLVNNAADFVNY